jgi:hypothetical protein
MGARVYRKTHLLALNHRQSVPQQNLRRFHQNRKSQYSWRSARKTVTMRASEKIELWRAPAAGAHLAHSGVGGGGTGGPATKTRGQRSKRFIFHRVAKKRARTRIGTYVLPIRWMSSDRREPLSVRRRGEMNERVINMSRMRMILRSERMLLSFSRGRIHYESAVPCPRFQHVN